MENTFKSSVFGGFNRDDVIRYIEKTSLESKQQIEALEQESDGLCRENAELRDKLAAAERERDKLAESYSTASSAQDALKKGLTAAQETISELRAQIEEGAQKLASAKADCDRQLKAKEEAAEQRIAELEAQHAERLSAAEQERKRLLSELDELRPQVEEYGRVKAHIADIELSARERADALDAATRERFQAMIAACRGRLRAGALDARRDLRERVERAQARGRCRRTAARGVHHAGGPARRAQKVRAVTR